MRKRLFVFCVLIIAFLVVWFVAHKLIRMTKATSESVLINEQAPNFILERVYPPSDGLSGEKKFKVKMALDDFRGKKIVLNFWASWCQPCREEAEVLERGWRKYRSQSIIFLGVAIHSEKAKVIGFLRQFKKTYPIVFDEEGLAALDYGVTGMPETFFIDEKGIVRYRRVGPMAWDVLQDLMLTVFRIFPN